MLNWDAVAVSYLVGVGSRCLTCGPLGFDWKVPAFILSAQWETVRTEILLRKGDCVLPEEVLNKLHRSLPAAVQVSKLALQLLFPVGKHTVQIVFLACFPLSLSLFSLT